MRIIATLLTGMSKVTQAHVMEIQDADAGRAPATRLAATLFGRFANKY